MGGKSTNMLKSIGRGDSQQATYKNPETPGKHELPQRVPKDLHMVECRVSILGITIL